MQIHQLKPKIKKKKKRVGRGGKRGTYSGKGTKGQKARAGASIRPGFRGGDTPLWKLFPKQRGATKKIEVKKGSPKKKYGFLIFNLSDLNDKFDSGETVSPDSLFEKGMVEKKNERIKILGRGSLEKKLVFKDISMSKSAQEKIR